MVTMAWSPKVSDPTIDSLYTLSLIDSLLTHLIFPAGYTTLNSLPVYPYVGGFSAVTGWNSPECGSCWSVGYKDKTIYVMAIDTSGSGFNLSKEAMQKLTNGEGIEAGKVDVTYAAADASYCSNTNWFVPFFTSLD